MRRVLVSIGSIVAIIFTIVALCTQEPYIKSKKLELASAEAELEKQKDENLNLKDEKSKIGTPEFTEKVARAKLGLVKDGELVFVDLEKQ